MFLFLSSLIYNTFYAAYIHLTKGKFKKKDDVELLLALSISIYKKNDQNGNFKIVTMQMTNYCESNKLYRITCAIKRFF